MIEFSVSIARTYFSKYLIVDKEDLANNGTANFFCSLTIIKCNKKTSQKAIKDTLSRGFIITVNTRAHSFIDREKPQKTLLATSVTLPGCLKRNERYNSKRKLVD